MINSKESELEHEEKRLEWSFRNIRSGPWNNEPDEVSFIDAKTGLKCLIRRDLRFGILCGYIVIPDEYIREEKEEEYECSIATLKNGHIINDEIPVNIHDGITFYGRNKDGQYSIGFDCRDFIPILNVGSIEDYKNIDFVKIEVKRLAEQVYEIINEITSN